MSVQGLAMTIDDIYTRYMDLREGVARATFALALVAAITIITTL